MRQVVLVELAEFLTVGLVQVAIDAGGNSLELPLRKATVSRDDALG